MSLLYAKHTNWPKKLSAPYIVKASKNLFSLFADKPSGITITAPGFYAPQGRKIRIPYAIKNLHEQLINFEYNGIKITNFEMETSALYGLAKLMGHNSLTLCTILANRSTNKYSSNYKKSINKLIVHALERLV